jgi:hypothetical protein
LALIAAIGLPDWYRRRRWTVLAFMVTVIWGQSLIANGIKLFVHREQPPTRPARAGPVGVGGGRRSSLCECRSKP